MRKQALNACFVLLPIVCLSLAGDSTTRSIPGSINRIEGLALLDGKPLVDGRAALALIRKSSTIVTAAAYAEVLLDPGMFLRIGPNTAARFVTIESGNIRIQLDRGEVLLDAAAAPRGAVSISFNRVTVRALESGLYEMDADHLRSQIYAGRAEVRYAAGVLQLRKREQVNYLNNALSVQRFETDRVDALYVWSARVAEYEAVASYGVALTLRSNPDGAAWRWDNAMHCWAYVPKAGTVPDPFGWSYPASARELREALILNGPYSGYPAAVDRLNHPRVFSTPAGEGTIDLTRAPRLNRPDVVTPTDQGPGVARSPVPSQP